VEEVEKDSRLSELSTHWTMLFEANHGTPEQSGEALRLMMLRYSGAVHRYFLKIAGNAETARELDQEFAVRFLKGDFLKYDPRVGRFRDYVKRAIRNLLIDHLRRQGKTRHLDTQLEISIVDDTSVEDPDQRFIESWRSELLDRAWTALEDFERRTGQPYHRALRFRAKHPDLSSPEMARRLAPELGQSHSPGAFRQLLQRARDKWTEFLIDEVRVSLKTPSSDEIEEELAELSLLELCRPAMKRLGLNPERN
jgi:RNA polymerase sigma-70 factor (ECF subfamily)